MPIARCRGMLYGAHHARYGSGAGMTERGGLRVHERWAQLRFSVIGQLLAAPPAPGTLRGELAKLAARVWRQPLLGHPVRDGLSHNELW
jgi:putative transposase